mgnify:CR=1 FL=1
MKKKDLITGLVMSLVTGALLVADIIVGKKHMDKEKDYQLKKSTMDIEIDEADGDKV